MYIYIYIYILDLLAGVLPYPYLFAFFLCVSQHLGQTDLCCGRRHGLHTCQQTKHTRSTPRTPWTAPKPDDVGNTRFNTGTTKLSS